MERNQTSTLPIIASDAKAISKKKDDKIKECICILILKPFNIGKVFPQILRFFV